MNKLFIALFLCFSTVITYGQSGKRTTAFNFGFERRSPNESLPDGWFNWGKGYDLVMDTKVKKSGNVSIRIEPTGEISEYNMGSIGFEIPANFAGHELELQAYMKLVDVSDGRVYLGITALDSIGTNLVRGHNYDANIQGTSDWTLYSVKMKYPVNTKTIYIGAALSGKGQLWVDDFQVFLDGKEIHKAKQPEPEDFKVDEDTEFDQGSGISSIKLTETITADLVTLGKLWGFLKYYHPGIASGNINWDYELFRTLPDVLQAEDLTERNVILEKWVRQPGNIKSVKEKSRNDQKEELGEIKLLPDLDWIGDPELGQNLMKKLAAIKSAFRQGDHYFVGLAPYVGNPVFKNEKPYATMIYPDAGFRLLSLYRYWNIIEYYFPYKHLIEEDWDDVLEEFIPKFVNAPNELEYTKTVLALIARIHDTHAIIYYQDSVLMKYKGLNYVPVDIEFVEEEAVVTRFSDITLGEQTGLEVGDVIESINHRKVQEIIREKWPYTSASNYPGKLRDIGKNLLRSNDTILTLECRRAGIPFSLEVKCNGKEKAAPYFDFIKRDTCFELLTSEIAYLYPGSIKNKYLPGIMPKIMETKGLIIDLRCYPSEFMVFDLSGYLLPEQTPFAKFSIGSITTPGLFTMTDTLRAGRKNEDYYKGKVVILVNEATLSNAEYTAMALRTAPGALVIGSPTAGADGDVSHFYLPGDILTLISGIGVYYPDGTETQRVGIVPDIEVKPTINGIREGRDELLEKAIEIIQGH